MPRKPLKPCKYPGCPNLTDGQFCPEHRKKADRDYNRFYRDPAHKERYHTAAWHTIRAAQLERYPLCEMCMAEGRYVKATLVHHRVPLGEGGTNAPENLCSLCAAHHTALHNKMRKSAGGNGAAGKMLVDELKGDTSMNEGGCRSVKCLNSFDLFEIFEIL